MPNDVAMETEQALAEYTRLVDTTLKPNLDKALVAQDAVQRELDDFTTLRKQLFEWKESSKTPPLSGKADLGHERVYCDVKVHDSRTVFVNVGFGFHVELTRDEALQYTTRRIDHLQIKLNRCRTNAEKLASHLASVQAILDQLDDLGKA